MANNIIKFLNRCEITEKNFKVVNLNGVWKVKQKVNGDWYDSILPQKIWELMKPKFKEVL